MGGIRILREAGTNVLNASYLPEGSAVFCRFLAPRKVRSWLPFEDKGKYMLWMVQMLVSPASWGNRIEVRATDSSISISPSLNPS